MNRRPSRSRRQLRTQRWARVIGIVLALSLLIPIVVSTAYAIRG